MAVGRRDFMKVGLTGLGATALVGNAMAADVYVKDEHHGADHDMDVEAKVFNPTNEPHRIRKNFYDLTDDELKTFMKAVGFMRNNYKLRDPRQWDNYALVHALHCTEANKAHQQVHWGWNFLPWHRGYLYFLERILANILTEELGLDGSKFALPYWDWSTQHGMPNTREREAAGLGSPFFGYNPSLEDMTADDGLGFDNSALYDGNRGPSPQKPQMDPANELTVESKEHVALTRYYMSPEYISMILSAPWDQFGGQPVTDRSTGQGLLEAGPHNCGHDWVGIRFGKNRNMGTLRCAAADPIFFMHHCNIDRIWDLYAGEQPDPYGDWGKPVYHWTDIDGKQVIATAEDIITKFVNVNYAPGGTNLTAFVSARKNLRFGKIGVNKVLDANVVKIPMPGDIPTGIPVIMDIETGPITYPGKYVVKILADGKQIGILNFLDGEYRVDNTYPDMVHTFSVLVTVPVGTRELEFSPPPRGAIKLDLRNVRYRPL